MKSLGKLKIYPSKEIAKSRVSIGFECLDRGLINPEKCYEPLAATGIKYARVQTGWAVCEKQKGIYDFVWLDKIIDSLISIGVIPWFNLGYGNPLYMTDVDLSKNSTCVGCVPIHYGEEATNAWINYVKALLDHYNGKVTHYEIWNEPDCEQFWYPKMPNGKEYAEFVNLTADVIKSTDSSILTGGSSMGLFTKDFHKGFVENVNGKLLDFFAYHAYSLKPENNYISEVKYLKDLFAKHGLSHVELWQGEGGCPTYYPDNHWLKNKKPGTERAQSVWIIRRYFLDLLAGTTMTSYFSIADIWEVPYEKARGVITKPAAHGILNGITYTKKHSYTVLSRIAAVFRGDVSLNDCAVEITDRVQDEQEIIVIPYKRNNNQVIAYYKPYYVEDEYDNRFDATINLSSTNIKNPVIIDLYSGEVYECEVEKNTIINAPIGQYPMLICDKDTYEIEG